MTEKSFSLRGRLAATLGFFFLLAIVALYVAVLSYGRLAADKSYDRLLAGSALSIAETVTFVNGRVEVDIPYASLEMLSAAPDDRVFYRVVGPDHQTVTGYADMPSERERSPLSNEDNSLFYDAKYRGEEVRFVSVGRELAQPARTNWVYVEVGQTRRARDALARELIIGSLVPILLLTLLALAVVWFGIDRALRPLGRLSSELSNRGPHELDIVKTKVPHEMQPVVEAINGFMSRLSGNVEALRSFIADAAHQIRTPLAAILAQAQVAEEGSPTEMRSGLAAVRRNAEKVTILVNQMLSDAIVQHRSDVRDFAPFDLIGTIQRCIRDSVPVAGDSDIRFTTKLREAMMFGDRIMIGEALKNLVQNALIHGHSEKGDVTITLAALHNGYQLTVADRGSGIKDGDFSRPFKRFARGNGDAVGAGLGLPIALQAIQSHGGKISLSNRRTGGLKVTVILPIKGQP